MPQGTCQPLTARGQEGIAPSRGSLELRQTEPGRAGGDSYGAALYFDCQLWRDVASCLSPALGMVLYKEQPPTGQTTQAQRHVDSLKGNNLENSGFPLVSLLHPSTGCTSETLRNPLLSEGSVSSPWLGPWVTGQATCD